MVKYWMNTYILLKDELNTANNYIIMYRKETQKRRQIYVSKGDTNVLQIIDEQLRRRKRWWYFLRNEVVNAIYSLKHGKAAGVDNIPAELITYAGEEITDILHNICSNIWETGIWPDIWTNR